VARTSPTKAAKPGPDTRDVRTALTQLEQIDSELKRRITVEDPKTYGIPDLLRPKEIQESDADFIFRQNSEIKAFVEALWINKDGRKILMKLSPPMVGFIADMFYRRTDQAILWKGRGTGGSLCSAIVIWLALVFHKMSFTMMAGSSEQAKQVYHYTKSFWDCHPGLARALLEDEPLMTETRLKNGVVLKIISASEKQARGKHNAGFCADETCQEAENTDRLISAAMQGAMSEPSFMVMLLSTFHHPIGLFQEVWDFAEERGYKRYNWNVYDSMERCDVGLETATPEDPKALEFCRTQCPLTEKAPVFDDLGTQTGWVMKGCCGKARDAQGFLARKNVIIAKKMNRGTNVFAVEYENERPNWMRPVYDVAWIEASMVDQAWPPPKHIITEKAIGIDWGLEGQTALVLTALVSPPLSREEFAAKKLMGNMWEPDKALKHVAVLESEFLTGKLTAEAIKVLMGWMEKYGQDKLYVYADASHPFNNLEVEQAGFDIRRIQFAKWKDYGIGNGTKYFTTPNRLKICSHLNGFIEQMKRYRQDKYGKPVKKDDHGPDAFLCAMLHYPFEEHFSEDLEPTPEELGMVKSIGIPKPLAPGFGGMFVPTPAVPQQTYVPPLNVNIKRVRKSGDGQVVIV